MKIHWNRATRLSQIVALVLFLAVFGLGYWLGDQHGRLAVEVIHY